MLLTNTSIFSSILLLVLRLLPTKAFSPTHPPSRRIPTSVHADHPSQQRETSNIPDTDPVAVLLGTQSMSKEEEHGLVNALRSAGFSSVVSDQVPNDSSYCYKLSKSTGMLQLVTSPKRVANDPFDAANAPQWVPMVQGEEAVLVANGWSFLDPDESEPMSAFDIDAANAEGQYKPKWGDDNALEYAADFHLTLSSLGYDIGPMNSDNILAEAESLFQSNEHSRGVLLDGKTDPPNIKMTANGHDFRGSAGQSDIPAGIFTCAIGGLPLFASTDLAPTTGSSGWLSFTKPIASDHVILVEPEEESMDRRVEVLCARSRCHLGHYFGRSEGYCINASALRFIPAAESTSSSDDDALCHVPSASRPFSWRPFDSDHDLTPSNRLLQSVLEAHGRYESVALGAGCFWHVEYALRRLPGVVTTEVGYAGGSKASPTYKDVCDGNTGHAEVVKVVYDPDICPRNVLIDCFLAMHDPSKVRAHGKHASTGQYRSCIFAASVAVEHAARTCLQQCRKQLGKEVSTDIRLVQSVGNIGQDWFWKAEDRHQRHDEKVKGKSGDDLSTLTATEWLAEYGRRRPSIIGSAETVLVGMDHPDDDGMARMMI